MKTMPASQSDAAASNSPEDRDREPMPRATTGADDNRWKVRLLGSSRRENAMRTSSMPSFMVRHEVYGLGKAEPLFPGWFK